MFYIESTTSQSVSGGAIWFSGTKEECEKALPRIKQFFHKLSDEFEIVKAEAQKG